VGLLGRLLGRGRRRRRDPLFALATAEVTLSARHGLRPTGRAGVCFRSVSSSFFQDLERELRGLLASSAPRSGSRFHLADDGYGFRWVVLEDPDFPDLVSLVHLVLDTFEGHGYGEQVVAVLFPFRDEEGRRVYWVYRPKRGRFYPFVPLGEGKRDNTYELRLAGKLARELPMEEETEQWYALWGTPVDGPNRG